MTQVILGCDSNANNEACQNTVYKMIQDAGYQCQKLEVAPGPFAEYSYRSEAKGKIGVYLMAGSLVSYLDAADANFDYNVFGIRGDITESLGTPEGFQKNKVPPDHDGCAHPKCGEYGNKYTYPQLNEMYKGKCVAVPGTTFEELGKNVVAALQGKYTASPAQSSDDEEEEWDDKDNFTPHKGALMEIVPYRAISSVSYDKSYDSPTGTGTVNILYHSKDYKYLYKGVMMKMKLRRSCDNEWSPTGLEEPDYDEDEKFFKEHIPTDELLKELGIPNYRRMQREGPSGSSSTSSTDPNASTDPNSQSDSQNGSSSSSSSSSGNSGSSQSGSN